MTRTPKASTTKRRWYHPRLADPFALLGAVGFASLLIDRFVSGTPSDAPLAGLCVVLMLGAPVQRGAEVILEALKAGGQR